MAFAIMRIEKRKDIRSVQRCADHQLRAVDTPNADPKRGIRVLVGSSDARAVAAFIRDRTKPLIKRHDAIRCMDVFCGASPEFFANGGSIFDFEALALKWAEDTFGIENIAVAVTHEDELTPHLALLVTPITPRGKLSASHWLDGPKKLEKMQDSFAEAMCPLGLERGIKGSKARHEDVSKWYAELAPRMLSAQARIDDAQKIIDASSAAEADIAIARAAVFSERAEIEKMKLSAQRVEDYQARKKLELEERETALKSAEKVAAQEMPRRIEAESKVAVLKIKNKRLADDKNVLHNLTITFY